MNTTQYTTLGLEISALLLLVLYLALFVREKFRNVEKRALFAANQNDARIIHKSLVDDLNAHRVQILLIAVLTALMMGLVFCVSFLDFARINRGISLYALPAASAFVYLTGVYMILCAMYRLRESRIMAHKFVYRNKNALGKTVIVSLLRQSLYYLDKRAFSRKKQADFTMVPGPSVILILVALSAFQAFAIIYFMDCFAPMW
jgi:hypothetical protein